MSSAPVTVLYEGRENLLPAGEGESVREFRATLASALGVQASELRLTAPGGALLADDRALLEYGLSASDVVLAERVTSLRAVLARTAAMLVAAAPTIAFCAALPLVLYFGLRRRGAPLMAAAAGALRLPFSD